MSTELAPRHRNAAPQVSRDVDATVFWLDGEHDIATVSVLTDSLARAASGHAANLIVDLSGVTFMSAATIGVLIGCRNSMRRQLRTMTVRSPSRCARRVFDACGLSRLFL